MKKHLLILALVAMSSSANAVHIYADSTCTSSTGAIQLKYDGPGSNYASGGYYNFYVGKSSKGLLAAEPLGDSKADAIGKSVGDKKVEVTFQGVLDLQIGDSITTPIDCTGVENGEFTYEHTVSESIRKIKIKKISREASEKLKLNENDTIRLFCQNSQNIPVPCN